MQVITRVSSLLPNATSANLIVGEIGEFLAGRSVVNLYARSAAVGTLLLFQIGSEVFLPNQAIGTQAGFPSRNENLLVSGVGGRGERIFITGTNTTAGAIIIQFLLDIIRV